MLRLVRAPIFTRNTMRVVTYHRLYSSEAEEEPKILTSTVIDARRKNPYNEGINDANERIKRVNDYNARLEGRVSSVRPTVKFAFDTFDHPFVTGYDAGLIFDELQKRDPVFAEINSYKEKFPYFELKDTISLQCFMSSILESLSTNSKSIKPKTLTEIQEEAWNRSQKVLAKIPAPVKPYPRKKLLSEFPPQIRHVPTEEEVKQRMLEQTEVSPNIKEFVRNVLDELQEESKQKNPYPAPTGWDV